jgi:type I restriction enzyme S subunit
MLSNTVVSEGFQVTELGIIPNDWLIKEFQDVMNGFFSGATPYRGRPEYYTGNIKWITSGELNYNIITNTAERITEEAVRNTNLKILPKGTFLFAITGLEAEGTRGSCGITGVEATTNQSCMALFPKETLDNGYLYHFYVWQGKMLAFKYCQGTKQQSYTGKIARTLPIILPPSKSEQTAIAIALSDTDTLIENLEKLIAKKRNIKQGVMQELLTGKKRLAGFNGKLVERKLGEVAEVLKGRGLSKEKLHPEGEIPCILYGELFTSYNRIINTVKSKTNIDEGELSKAGDVLMPGSTTTIGIDLAIASTILQNNVLLGGDIIIIRPSSKYIDSIFLSYYLTEVMKYRISELTQGITIIHLYGKDLRTLRITLPPIEEQSAVANLFKEIDSEIEMLQKKLTKYRMIKQGMMQVLLTGKIRLL